MNKDRIRYFFKRPNEISAEVLDQIQNLIKRGGSVGTAWLKENLEDAFLIGYATHRGKVVGSVTHKRPKRKYREKIEGATGLNLSGYLERGYTTVDPKYRFQDIADVLIKGLIKRSPGKRIYVTINMANIPPLKLTYKNGMFLAAKFTNPRTGHEIGVFTNQDVSC
ncbi:MAG: hypothetical protein GWN31_05410 [Candidatus Thorarchaeota archaeon]|nr:hypothetical protein [Candidatus Thorarchaeota archaeon]NIW13365.1 hypothetical protein [Candidatus Thorarchaeota archaeon]NIW51465.1 hypothetical protein [Candidatus Korarchaeota archaeon]